MHVTERESIIKFKQDIRGIPVSSFKNEPKQPFFKRQKKQNPLHVIPERFVKLFNDHGVAVAQIPRLIHEIGLMQLESAETLLPAMTPEVIEKAAKLFQIRREWLEGTSPQLYEYRWYYKAPHHFFEELKLMRIKEVHFPIIALCTDPNFDVKRYREQPIALILRERCADLGQQQVLRYRVFSDGMDWSYSKCRIQIKAMVRLLEPLESFCVIPLYCVSLRDLRAVESGCCVPQLILDNAERLHEISLEDFSLFPEESAVSKGSEELPRVLEYIKATRLEEYLEDLGPLPTPYT